MLGMSPPELTRDTDMYVYRIITIAAMKNK